MRRMLSDHYASKTLRLEARDRLTSLALAGGNRVGLWRRWRVPAGIAAALVLALVVATRSGARGPRLGDEIARNHARQLDPEFRSTSYEEVAQRMDRLDFELRPSKRLASRGCRLVGARYCSLEGRIAAQLQLTDSQNRSLTLYVVRAKEPLPEYRSLHGGVPVEVWQEGELIYGLAGGGR